MRKLALVLPLALLTFSCSTFTWTGQGAGLTEDQADRGARDAGQLAREYDTESYWADVRARRDGRVNAWAAGFTNIQNTLDRHFFNYSPTDPYLNHPTSSNIIEETGRFGLGFIAR